MHLRRTALCRVACVFRGVIQARRNSTVSTMTTSKPDLPKFKTILTSDLLKLESLFTSQGYGFRLVGGVVRDLLLDRAPKDIDIATDCTPDVMMKIFDENGVRYIPTGLQHGTITVHCEAGVDYEVTTLRVDRVTDGRHAVVDFTKDWRLDALRRDLTINAMGLTLDGTLYDYFDGLKHLEQRRVQFVGEARDRIQEDYLRILRYFRFYGRIAPAVDCHDADTLTAIRENVAGLRGVSIERVWSEVKKILVGSHAPHLITLMYKLGVAHCIGLPEDGNVVELERAWCAMCGRGHIPRPEALLMSLVNTVQESYDLSHVWKLSNDEKRLGAFIVQHRELACQANIPLKTFQDMIVDGALVRSVVELLRYCDRHELAEEVEKWRVPKVPVNGHDLKVAGFRTGSEMGSILKLLKTQWKESYFKLNKEELLELAAAKTEHTSTV